MPDLSLFPKSHIVTFRYYNGVIHFLEEDYAQADEHLAAAWSLCLHRAARNKELILTYLIPCRLLTTHTLPSAPLLAPHPALAALFQPIARAIRRGDLAAFDAALAAAETPLVKRRVYLTCERGRDVALRNLFRKVYVAGGWEEGKEGEGKVRRTRVPVAEFVAAVRVGCGQGVERDEVECLLANLIYKVRDPSLNPRCSSFPATCSRLLPSSSAWRCNSFALSLSFSRASPLRWDESASSPLKLTPATGSRQRLHCS